MRKHVQATVKLLALINGGSDEEKHTRFAYSQMSIGQIKMLSILKLKLNASIESQSRLSNCTLFTCATEFSSFFNFRLTQTAPNKRVEFTLLFEEEKNVALICWIFSFCITQPTWWWKSFEVRQLHTVRNNKWKVWSISTI